MTYKTFKTFTCIMIASLFINVAVVIGQVNKPRQAQEPPAITLENKVYSYLVSLNTSKGARHYHMTAGRRVGSVELQELYLSFGKRCFSHICKDCNDMLKYELSPILFMIQSDWRDLTGCGVINLIDREGIHRWTFREDGFLVYNLDILRREEA